MHDKKMWKYVHTNRSGGNKLKLTPKIKLRFKDMGYSNTQITITKN